MQRKFRSMVFIIFLVILPLQLLMGWLMHNVSMAWGIIINQILIIVGIPFFIVKFVGKKKLDLQFSKPNLLLFVAVVIATLAFAALIDYLIAATEYFVSVPENLHIGMERLLKANTPAEYASKILLLAALPAVCEEIFFRGICQTTLVGNYGRIIGILISSILFAVAHTNPWYIHLYFILSIFLGWVYDIGKTLWLPIICHFVNNFWTITNNYNNVGLPVYNFKADTAIVILAIIAFYLSVYYSIRVTTSKSDLRGGDLGVTAG